MTEKEPCSERQSQLGVYKWGRYRLTPSEIMTWAMTRLASVALSPVA